MQIKSKLLHEEKEKARVLQEALHALALEHHELEQSYSRQNIRARSYSVEDDEFFDCDEDDIESLSESKSFCCKHRQNWLKYIWQKKKCIQYSLQNYNQLRTVAKIFIFECSLW